MSQAIIEEVVPLSSLPPLICNNPRKKIVPEQVGLNTLIVPHVTHKEQPKSKFQEATLPACPRYPLAIIWSPDRIYFELDEEPVIQKLCIWNGCPRTIYIHCCGLWNETARLGASWQVKPRTRFHLASGLKAKVYIKVTPRMISPIPSACVGLQLAASHKRDNVTGYFAVPIFVKFLKYITAPIAEDG